MTNEEKRIKERILIAPGVKDSDLRKSLALRGIGSFNLRILSAEELAKRALLQSGISLENEIISGQEEAVILSKESPKEPYFSDITYTDVIRIASAIRSARSFIPFGDEEKELERILKKGPFEEKNTALINIFKRYKEALNESQKTDGIALIRKAIAEAKPLDASILVLEEFPLNPLQQALVDHLSNNKAEVHTLPGLFGLEEKETSISAYYNCYGASNEVEQILDLVFRNNKLDESVVAVSDVNTYAQLFFDYSILYDIPITFGTGIPIGNSNPAKLLKLYHHWIGDGLYGRASIAQMLNSPSFDKQKLKENFPKDDNFSWGKFVELLGDIRFTENKESNLQIMEAYEAAVSEEGATVNENRADEWKGYQKKLACLPALRIMAQELGEPCEVFISRYSYIRSVYGGNTGKLLNLLDAAASAAIYDELSVVRSAGIEFSDKDLIQNLLKKSVCTQKSAPGFMHITTIPGAFSSLRKNLFVAGLSATKFPGSPKEDYLLLDEDLDGFDGDLSGYQSTGVTMQKVKNLENLLHFASAMDAVITLSYAGQNLSELKKDNASSFLFKALAKQYGADQKYEELESHIRKVGYFEPAVSSSRLIGESYNADIPVKQETVTVSKGQYSQDVQRRFAPSAIELFFSCRKQFFLRYILGLFDPAEDDLFSVIAANDRGTLAHSLMEFSGNNPALSKEEFLEECAKRFDRYIVENRPLIAEKVESEKADFLEMMSTAKDMERGNEVVLEEQDIEAAYGGKLMLHGYPDRVERLEDGSLLVVDFKSGATVKHIKNDVDSCLQVMIYAYILHKMGYSVKGGEYRYIRLGEVEEIEFNNKTQARLFEKLDEFCEAIEKGDYPYQSSADLRAEACRYCKFGELCGLNPDWEE